MNHQIVYHLQDALNLLPDLMDPSTTESFASSTNDQMLVVYLSSLLRAVIALHALVDNKMTTGKAELEEGETRSDREKEKEKEKTSKKEEENVAAKDSGESNAESKKPSQ